MWIFLSNAYLSIVSCPTDRTKLLVRARVRGDIERVFGSDHAVTKTPGRDYLYRATIPRRYVAAKMVCLVTDIDYGNFKDSVADNQYHDACSRTWFAMKALQDLKETPTAHQNRSRKSDPWPKPKKIPRGFWD